MQMLLFILCLLQNWEVDDPPKIAGRYTKADYLQEAWLIWDDLKITIIKK